MADPELSNKDIALAAMCIAETDVLRARLVSSHAQTGKDLLVISSAFMVQAIRIWHEMNGKNFVAAQLQGLADRAADELGPVWKPPAPGKPV